MALATQPNGSTQVPVAGAPRTTSGTYTVTGQNQNTLVVYHKANTTNVEAISIIQS